MWRNTLTNNSGGGLGEEALNLVSRATERNHLNRTGKKKEGTFFTNVQTKFIEGT